MNTYVRAILLITTALLSAQQSFAKGWRGITPLHSTRADVMRLLGQCSEQREACVFRLDREDVYILFSGGLRNEYAECARTLPPETVIFIQVEPREKRRLDDFPIEKKMLEKLNPSSYPGRGVKAFRTKDGLVVSTLQGKVLHDYIAPAPYSQACRSYYEEPESFVQTFVVHPPVSVSIECPSKEVPAGADLIVTCICKR